MELPEDHPDALKVAKRRTLQEETVPMQTLQEETMQKMVVTMTQMMI
jgi:hypothetical protein